LFPGPDWDAGGILSLGEAPVNVYYYPNYIRSYSHDFSPYGQQERGMFYGWWVLTACFIMGSYVAAAVFWGFTAFFEPLVKEFNWSYAEVSFAISLRGMEMGVLAPMVGFLVDRYSPRLILTIGIASVGMGLLILSQTTNLFTFYISILLLSFGAGGCTSVVHMSLMANWFKRRLGLAMGIMGSGFGCSGLIIPLIVSWIDTYGWRETLVGLGLGMWVICLPLCLVIRNRPEDMGLYPDGQPPEPKAPKPKKKEDDACPAEPLPIGAPNFKSSCLTGSFYALFATEAIRSLVIASVSLHVMPYMSSVGMDRSTAGMVAAGMPLVSVAGRFGFGYLGDKFDKRWLMMITLGMMTLGLLVYYPLQGPGLAILFLLLFAPGLGGGMVIRATLLSHCFNKAHFGRLLGLVMAAASIGGIVGPFFAGWYFDTFGDYRPLWLVFAVLTAAAATMVRFVKPIAYTGK
jgi:MFS family permease